MSPENRTAIREKAVAAARVRRREEDAEQDHRRSEGSLIAWKNRRRMVATAVGFSGELNPSGRKKKEREGGCRRYSFATAGRQRREGARGSPGSWNRSGSADGTAPRVPPCVCLKKKMVNSSDG